MSMSEDQLCSIYLSSYPVLVSGWSDNGWLSGGHAVRMALELCWWYFFVRKIIFVDTTALALPKAWPQLLKRINTNQANTTDDRDLIVASRTWFALYLFEHQSV